MFKELGQLAGLMKNIGRVKEEMAAFQSKLGGIHAEADAGAGMVQVKVNGQMEILSVRVSDDALKDREVLEDLIKSATNQAIKKARETVKEHAQKMASELGLPAGMNLPGLE